MSDGTNVTTPPGRIVWGNPTRPQHPKDDHGNFRTDDAGNRVVQWVFGLAIPKQTFAELGNAIQKEAASIFPNGMPRDFAWKMVDGDGTDPKGLPYSNREGYAGCVVLTISSQLPEPPQVVRHDGQRYVEWSEVKTGDYVRAGLTLKAHAGKAGMTHSKPGLYINPRMIDFIGYGTAIVNGPNAEELFSAPVQLPVGASATPVANNAAPPPAGMSGGGMPPANTGQANPPGFPTQGVAFDPAGVEPTAPGMSQTGHAAGPANQTASPSDQQHQPGSFVQGAMSGFPGMGGN